MSHHVLRAFLLGILTLFLAAPSTRAAEPIVTSDLLKIRRTTSIDVARTGHIAVASIHSIAREPNPDFDVADPASPPHVYRQRSHLFLYHLDGRTPARPLTFGDRFDTNPQLSPDGRTVAFIRRPQTRGNSNGYANDPNDPDNSPQLWLMPVDGGEAIQRTELPRGAYNPIWSPDGSSILVISSVPIDELPGRPGWSWDRPGRNFNDAALPHTSPDGTIAQIRNWLTTNARSANPVVIHRLDFQDEQAIKTGYEFTQLFLVSMTNPDAEPRRITSAFFDHNDPAFTPDGRHIVYSRKPDTPDHPDRVLDHVIRRIAIDGTNDQTVLAMPGWSLHSPRPSRDGTLLAYTGEQTDNPAFRFNQLGIGALESDTVGETVWLTDTNSFDAQAYDIRWMTNRPALLFRTAMRGSYPVMQASPGLLEPAPYIAGAEGEFPGIHTYDTGGGNTVYALTKPSNPCVLRMRDAGGNDTLLDDLNTWVANKRLSLPTEKWLERPDGTRIQYWIMEPTNRQSGRTYPLCLEIHGGPMVMWGPGEFTMWHEFQLLCSWGYGVIYANPRGSGGYGEAFQRGNEQNWGDGPAGDVLAAVDAALLEPWVDPDRLVVTGGSYAGYLTAWIVGHDHRFKAAVAQRGVYDLNTFFGEGNAWRLVPYMFGGYPWDARTRPVLQRESPFTYVNRIRTPLLIMHASNDLRTGVSQSEMLFRALAAQGKLVEYVRYPNAGHDLSRTGDPLHRLDRLNRIIEFFERFIDNDRRAPVDSSSN